jgi:hypothetical protein
LCAPDADTGADEPRPYVVDGLPQVHRLPSTLISPAFKKPIANAMPACHGAAQLICGA